MGRHIAITRRLFGDDDLKVVLQPIDSRCSNAATGGETGHDERVDTLVL